MELSAGPLLQPETECTSQPLSLRNTPQGGSISIHKMRGLLIQQAAAFGQHVHMLQTLVTHELSHCLSVSERKHEGSMTSSEEPWQSSIMSMVYCSGCHVLHVQVLDVCPNCGPALAFLADSCSAQKLLLTQRGTQKLADAATSEGMRLFEALEIADPMRAQYWQLCQAHLLDDQ